MSSQSFSGLWESQAHPHAWRCRQDWWGDISAPNISSFCNSWFAFIIALRCHLLRHLLCSLDPHQEIIQFGVTLEGFPYVKESCWQTQKIGWSLTQFDTWQVGAVHAVSQEVFTVMRKGSRPRKMSSHQLLSSNPTSPDESKLRPVVLWYILDFTFTDS